MHSSVRRVEDYFSYLYMLILLKVEQRQHAAQKKFFPLLTKTSACSAST